MKILIASIPGAGHLNPLLSIASLLVEYGHEVAIQVSEDLRPPVESAGHRFLSEIPNAQTSGGYYFDNYPGYRERAHQLSLEFASHDVEAELLSLIEECVLETVRA